MVERVLQNTPVFDIHTHLYPPGCLRLGQTGIENLLTYHYLTAEYLSASGTPPNQFFRLPASSQAESVWNGLFRDRTPHSEAARGVMTVLSLLGVDASSTDYKQVRDAFPRADDKGYPDRIMQMAHVDRVIMTNDPLDPEGWSMFKSDRWDRRRFSACIRLDGLLFPTAKSGKRNVIRPQRKAKPLLQVLERSVHESRARCVALSMSNVQLAALLGSKFTTGALLPWLAERRLPLFLMLGVRRGVHAAYRDGGDGMESVDFEEVERLLDRFPKNRFMMTSLSYVDQHALCVLGKIFPHAKVFGAWWYLNQPGLVKEVLKLRLDILGLNFIPQHSDARVFEHLLYKWAHFKQVFSEVLVDRYQDWLRAGRAVTEDVVKRDVRTLLHDNASSWLGDPSGREP